MSPRVSKELISIRVSRAALARLRATGPGWQTRLAAIIEASAEQLPAPKGKAVRS